MSAAAIVEDSTIFSAGWAIARHPYAWEGHGAQSAAVDGIRTCFVPIMQGGRPRVSPETCHILQRKKQGQRATAATLRCTVSPAVSAKIFETSVYDLASEQSLLIFTACVSVWEYRNNTARCISATMNEGTG
ncbi:hypothetical protein [Methylorubrum populi]